MHTFKGWAIRGLRGKINIDFEQLSLHHAQVTLETRYLDTGDDDKNRAMRNFFKLDQHPETGFVMTECRELCQLKNNKYKMTVLGILDFVSIRRQLPITAMLTVQKEKIIMDLHFKWSFKAYGLKPPRLLFMTVRDIVDIKAHLEFIQDNTEEE